MSPSPNFWPVYEKLADDEVLAPRAAWLVEAAMLGDAELDQALSDRGTWTASKRERPPSASGEVPRAFLRRIVAEGFRGIGPGSTLDLEPGPGLTLVVGRNGSGKSSFVEGLELLLTGDSTRWTGKKPVRQWRSGWRNLHTSTGPVSLTAQLTVEHSREPVSVSRRWEPGANLKSGTLAVRRGSEAIEGALQGLGWEEALASSRPFLSYNDISGAWDSGPSKLFDALMGMLGLEDVRDALGRLSTARRDLDKARKAHDQQTEELIAALQDSEDPRARTCARALMQSPPDLERLDGVLGEGEQGGGAEIDALRRLASLRVPDEVEVLRAVEALDQAVKARDEATGTQAAHALTTADLLDQAVRWHVQTEIDVCPVCGTPGVLGESWREAARDEVQTLRSAAEQASAAREQMARAVRQARGLVSRTPEPGGHLDAMAAAVAAHRAWSDLPEQDDAIGRHLERTWTALSAAVSACRDEATARLEALHADWRPLRNRLEDWREAQRAVQEQAPDRTALKAAQDWLKQADAELRATAFAPIAEQAKRTWSLLRAQSNVDISGVTLKGSSTQRKVDLDVTVDGTEGVALGVMSQGELHALALALFLPRLLRADSPFGFVVIDDPVQAMDPAKVDGLATVLSQAAQTHQVVVFTHDPRLPAATRRLGLDATVLEVRRNLSSQVDVRVGQDPVGQHLSDAFHLLDQRAELGDDIVRRVVPGLCRSAVEAALTRRIWREQLARGEVHADIAERIRDCTGLHQVATLAFFGDTSRGAELYRRLRRIRDDAVDVFILLKRHAHEPLPDDVDVRSFILDARDLAQGVLQ